MKKISAIIIIALLCQILLPSHVLACAKPDITVIPESIDFGVVSVNSSSSEKVVTISNVGDGDLCIYYVALNGIDTDQFTINNKNAATNVTLPPGGSVDVSVQFKPLTTGNKIANLVIHSNDPDECYVFVPLSGVGVLPSYADLEITKSDNPDPVVTSGTITYTVNVVNYGPDVATGITATDTLPEGVTFLSATPSTGLAEYLSGNITWTIGSMASGDSANIVIKVNAPAQSGIITNHVTVSGYEADPIPANNEATEDTNITTDTGNTPDIDVSPLSVNFGSIELGIASAPAIITVTNKGNADLVIDSIVVDNSQFLLTSASIAGQTLNPGASTYIMVIFRPAFYGVHSGTLSIFSNDPDENPVVVSLSGYGIVTPPATINTPLPGTTSPSGIPDSRKYFTVDFLGKITRVPASIDGRPMEDITASSPDNTHVLEIDRGTLALDKDGNPVTYIVIGRIRAPQLPENTALLGEAYNFKPSGTIFDRSIRLTLGYNIEDLPDELISIATAYYDPKIGWKYLDSTGNQVAEVGKLSAAVGHFTVFAILAQVPAELPPDIETKPEIPPLSLSASFLLSNLAIAPSSSKYGETLTFLARYGEDAKITLDVANKGGNGGIYQAVLRLNGEEKDSIEFSLGAGETRHITFNTTGNNPGKYIVQIGELHGEFTSEIWINWWLIVTFAFLLILLGWLVVFLIRRRIGTANQEE